MVEILVSLLPVFIFLLILIYLDSYKLVKINTVLFVILIGCATGLLSYIINKALLNFLQIDITTYARYIAPIIEESLKAAFIIYMISKKKIGFMVDAVIYGFAIGAGFAFIENIYYLSVVESSSIFLWIIRGFGTAVMHGGTTTIFSIITKNIFDRSDKIKVVNYLPGLISAALYHSLFLVFMPGLFSAIIIHSVFNQLLLPAVAITVLQLFLLPVLIIFVFHRSEVALRDWMETGLDKEVQLLEQLDNGKFSESHAGQYLLSLQDKFSGTVLVDILCSIKIHLELSIKAKGVLLMRKAGLPVVIEEDVKDKLNELKYLEKSIGPTGKLAVAPIYKMSTMDLWQLYMLGLK
jgi:RsiW-degrading membrane proteinase PrsW (M82 family)